jgi:hypothetical protein
MNLNPSTFGCSAHDVNLTPDVEDAVSRQVPVSSFGVEFGDGSKRSKQAKRFRVIVQCPGADDRTAHKLIFTGTVS